MAPVQTRAVLVMAPDQERPLKLEEQAQQREQEPEA